MGLIVDWLSSDDGQRRYLRTSSCANTRNSIFVTFQLIIFHKHGSPHFLKLGDHFSPSKQGLRISLGSSDQSSDDAHILHSIEDQYVGMLHGGDTDFPALKAINPVSLRSCA